jgi:hypothetical protein
VLGTQKDPIFSPINFLLQGGNSNDLIKKLIISQLGHNAIKVA